MALAHVDCKNDSKNGDKQLHKLITQNVMN